jgi:hypothetical protein
MSDKTEREIIADFLAAMAGRNDAPILEIGGELKLKPFPSGIDLDISGTSIGLNSSQCRILAEFLIAGADAIDMRDLAKSQLRRAMGG